MGGPGSGRKKGGGGKKPMHYTSNKTMPPRGKGYVPTPAQARLTAIKNAKAKKGK